MISSDADVQSKAKQFFEDYVFVTTGFKDFTAFIHSDKPQPTVEVYNSMDDFNRELELNS